MEETPIIDDFVYALSRIGLGLRVVITNTNYASNTVELTYQNNGYKMTIVPDSTYKHGLRVSKCRGNVMSEAYVLQSKMNKQLREG